MRKRCPVCAQRTLNPLVALIAPRCKVCKARYRVSLPFGLGFGGHYVSRGVLLAAVAAALFTRRTEVFSVGLIAFAAMEVAVVAVGRLEPDSRDPVTVMQLRRYARRLEP